MRERDRNRFSRCTIGTCLGGVVRSSGCGCCYRLPRILIIHIAPATWFIFKAEWEAIRHAEYSNPSLTLGCLTSGGACGTVGRTDSTSRQRRGQLPSCGDLNASMSTCQEKQLVAHNGHSNELVPFEPSEACD